MGRSLRIGTAFGIGLYVHWTFLIIPLFALLSGVGGGIDGMIFSVVFALGVFGCVLLHELGHALMARSFGIGTRDITLLPIGGVARLERMSEKPGEEIAIAVAGPLVNVVIAAGLAIGMALAGLAFSLWGGSLSHVGLGEQLLLGLLWTNVVLVLFNLIPAFPMDGGRVFRALLSLGLGRLRGTEVAVTVSKVFAVGFVVAGFWFHQFFLPVIGLFIMFAGSQELAMLRYQTRRPGQPVTIDQPPAVLPAEPPAQPVQPNFSGFIWDPRAGAWIEWRNGQPVGATYVNGAAPRW